MKYKYLVEIPEKEKVRNPTPTVVDLYVFLKFAAGCPVLDSPVRDICQVDNFFLLPFIYFHILHNLTLIKYVHVE